MPTYPIPLESTSAELIFAPLHDPLAAAQVDLQLEALQARGVSSKQQWCWYQMSWGAASAGEPALQVTVPCPKIDPRFERLLCCVTSPASVEVALECEVGGAWVSAGPAQKGTGSRMEMNLPLPSAEVSRVRMTLTPNRGEAETVKIHWLGLQDPVLLKQCERGKIRYDSDWSGLIEHPGAEDPEAFQAGLLFDASDLPALRRKAKQPGWREHFAVMERQAQKNLERVPEDQLSDYAPFTDERYTRAHECGRWNYYIEGPLTAFVGRINQDPDMLNWAARVLMCMAHTPHWCQSAESRLPGSAWDQRAFVETMMTTAGAIMMDLLDDYLTPRARDLTRQVLWDRGLSFIERDLMKFDYMHRMNQAPWFCQARILAGLLLEKTWPRTNGYVDRAVKELREDMDAYLLPDGGTDEGMGYWSQTYHQILPALLAYARSRDLDVRDLLPSAQAGSEEFLRVMSAMEPGCLLMDADNSTNHVVGDTMAIMSGLYPDSVYSDLVGACLLEERPFTYFDHYLIKGVFALIFGPESLPEPREVVPTFSCLEQTGHLTSLRRDKQKGSVRIHVSGSRAYPSHSHFDKSNVTVELDGVPVLIDRGMVRYDDPRGAVMPWSCMHNVITPVLEDGSFGCQTTPLQPIIPQGSGDEENLHVSVDVTSLWKGCFSRCVRRLDSGSPNAFTLLDEVESPDERILAFHLQASAPFLIDGRTVELEVEEKRLRIELPWAERVEQFEEGIDYKFDPVYHLVAYSANGTKFSLETQIIRS